MKRPFGIFLIVAIVLFVIWRPITDNYNNVWLHALCTPYYFDLYILGLEEYWPWPSFHYAVHSVSRDQGQLACCISAFSTTICIILHLFAFATIFEMINHYLLRKK